MPDILIMAQNEIQVQNIPRDINPRNPHALKQVIELSKEIQNRLNDLEKKIIEIDRRISNLSFFGRRP